MKDKSRPPSLEDLSLRLARSFQRALEDEGPTESSNGAEVTPAAGLPPEEDLWELADQIFDHLQTTDRNEGFESARELYRAWDYWDFGDAQRKNGDLHELSKLIQSALTSPQPSYRFALHLLGQSQEWAEPLSGAGWLIGGPNELSCKLYRIAGATKGVTLSGVVRGSTVDGVARKIENVVGQFAGALRSAGLVRFWGVYHSGGYVPAAARITGHLTSDGGENIDLDPMLTRLMNCCNPGVLPVSDMDRRKLRLGEYEALLARPKRIVERLLKGESERANELRDACRRAVHAEFTSELGVTLTLAFSCIEGLLLAPSDKEDIGGRLGEAVAHSLGRSHEDRAQLRQQVKELYSERSKFVHRGASRPNSRWRDEALGLLYRVIQKEIELLPEPNVPTPLSHPSPGAPA